MKPCNVCARVLPDDAFSIARQFKDGLARTCRECNAARCLKWYDDNEQQKKQYAREYKAAVEAGTLKPRTPHEPRPSRLPRAEAKRAEKLDVEPDDYQFIRFSQSEWMFVLQAAQDLEITPSDYVRNLVRDARRKAQKGLPDD